MDLGDDYTEEVKDADVGDDTTASEVEQAPIIQSNPFLKYCGDVLKDVDRNAKEYNLKQCNFSEKDLTRELASDWKLLGRKMPCAEEKWYHEDFLDPLLRDDVREEDWVAFHQLQQLKIRVTKNIFVDSDKADMLTTIGNARTKATCSMATWCMGANESDSTMITVIGPKPEVNLAINLMSDEESRLNYAMTSAGEKVKEKRYTRGQVDIEKRRQRIADCLRQGKKVPQIMVELGCSETLG